ncbi:MAG: heat-inducible transcriptional repressor HrcA [Firmicutes bacterium]|nr:heat-inducible transcriptional repressor HrcA [Bacillota bacterium]
MKLSDRKQKILQAVIDDYVADASPISSKHLQESVFPDLSSATIRNELMALEEMGYLLQPHTSAGRIPSLKAYEYYVDSLMSASPLTVEEIAKIENYFTNQISGIDEIVKKTAKLISDITNYTSVVVVDNLRDVIIEKIKLVPLGKKSALLVIVTGSGVIKDSILEFKNAYSDDYFKASTDLLNRMYIGKTLADIDLCSHTIDCEIEQYLSILQVVIDAIKRHTVDLSKRNIALEGQSKIFDHPEYRDVDKVREFMSLVSHKENIYPHLKSDNIQVSINVSNTDDKASSVSIVSASYRVTGKNIGNVGVIGPTRMDYSKVVSVLEHVGRVLDKIAFERIDDDEKC